MEILSDYSFWLGLVGTITGVTSLVIAVKRYKRAIRTEARLEIAEERARFTEDVSRRAAHILRLCETAAATAEKEGTKHPEWTNRTNELLVGSSNGKDCNVIYVNLVAQSQPLDPIQWSLTLHKWYLNLPDELSDSDTLAIFGELKKLLVRPGNLEFEIAQTTPSWVAPHGNVGKTVCLVYTDMTKL